MVRFNFASVAARPGCVTLLVFFACAASAAGCGAPTSQPDLNQPAAEYRAPDATFRITFGISDRSEQAWDGRLVLAPGQKLRLEPDLLRDHNYETGDDPKFPNDYVRADTSWVVSTRKAWMRARGNFQLELPSLLLHVDHNPAGSPIQVDSVRGRFSFLPAAIPAFRPRHFLDDSVRVERVVPPVPVARDQLGQQDYPSILQADSGDVWVAWQEFSDGAETLFVRRKSRNQWSPIVPLEEECDVFRSALAQDGLQRIWVVWSMQVDGNWDLYGRVYDGTHWSPRQRLTDAPGPDAFHHLERDADGELWMVWQTEIQGRTQIVSRNFDGHNWSPPFQVSQAEAAAGNNWCPAVAAGTDGSLAVVWDGYASGSYDVYLRRRDSEGWGPVRVLAGSPRYEAQPTVAIDAENRIWVAWQESGTQWGKDTGRLAPQSGTQLHESRKLRVICLDGDRVLSTAGDLAEVLPGQDWELPHLEVGPQGRPWLFVRHLVLRQPDTREVRGKLGPAYFPRWEIHATRYDEAGWDAPLRLARSSGRNHMLPDSSSRTGGKLWLTWATDHRNSKTYMPQQHQVFMAAFAPAPAGSSLELMPIDAPDTDPRVQPAERQVATAPVHPAETEQLQRIRSYRIESRGRRFAIFRGDLHRHTDISVDGAGDGSLLDAYRYARDAAGLDFIGVTDHTVHVNDPYTWWRTQKFADLFRLDNFAAFYSYERSVLFPNGHRNILFTERGRPILPILSQEARGLEGSERLFWYLRRYRGTSIPHTTVGGNDWRDNDPEVEHLVEIYQGLRDTYESAGAPRPGTLEPTATRSRPGHISNALDKGYRLGFIASSDHHSTHLSYACLLAEALSLDDLMEAIRARRAYAATDNIILDLRCFSSEGEHLMGEAFSSSTPIRLSVTVIGTGTVRRVDVIRDGKVVYQDSPQQDRTTFQFVDNDPAAEHYYYVRVLQENGMMAWGSPFWVHFTD